MLWQWKEILYKIPNYSKSRISLGWYWTWEIGSMNENFPHLDWRKQGTDELYRNIQLNVSQKKEILYKFIPLIFRPRISFGWCKVYETGSMKENFPLLGLRRKFYVVKIIVPLWYLFFWHYSLTRKRPCYNNW
jgi:hypothetical protein